MIGNGLSAHRVSGASGAAADRIRSGSDYTGRYSVVYSRSIERRRSRNSRQSTRPYRSSTQAAAQSGTQDGGQTSCKNRCETGSVHGPCGTLVEVRVRGDRERKREAVILTAARAFRRARLSQHLAGRHRERAQRHQADRLSLRREQGTAAVRVLPHRTQPDHGGLRGRSAARSGSARERLEYVISRYAEAITSDFGWCMVQAENQDLSPAMSRKVKALQVRHRSGHPPAAS